MWFKAIVFQRIVLQSPLSWLRHKDPFRSITSTFTPAEQNLNRSCSLPRHMPDVVWQAYTYGCVRDVREPRISGENSDMLLCEMYLQFIHIHQFLDPFFWFINAKAVPNTMNYFLKEKKTIHSNFFLSFLATQSTPRSPFFQLFRAKVLTVFEGWSGDWKFLGEATTTCCQTSPWRSVEKYIHILNSSAMSRCATFGNPWTKHSPGLTFCSFFLSHTRISLPPLDLSHLFFLVICFNHAIKIKEMADRSHHHAQ